MVTSDVLLAGFLSLHGVTVKKTVSDEGDSFILDISVEDPLVTQFYSTDGYNTNIAKLAKAMEDLFALPYSEEKE